MNRLNKLLTLTACFGMHFVQCMHHDPFELHNHDGLVKIIISNKSGQSLLIGSTDDSPSFTLNHNEQSPELPLLYYAPIKSLFDATKKSSVTFSSPQGAYKLHTWKEEDETMHVYVNMNNKLVKEYKNVPDGGTLNLRVDKKGSVKSLTKTKK